MLKSLDKIQHTFVIKTQKAGIEGMYLYIIKVTNNKLTAKVIFSEEKWIFFFRNETRIPILATFIQDYIGNP